VTVISILSILVAIALPQYKIAIIQAKEATLREDLFRFRDIIDQYEVDKGKYPASLQALVAEGYLRVMPKDPITGASDWKEIPPEQDPNAPLADSPGVFDVHSASEATALDGSPYAEW
jgi:general secretion pathway protein G